MSPSTPNIYLAQDFQGWQPVVNHLHWDGSLPPKVLFDFYQSRGQILKLPDKDILGKLIRYANPAQQLISSTEKLAEFQEGLLSKWSIIDVFKLPIGAMRIDHDLISMAVAHCHYLKEQCIIYSETRFAPSYHINPRGNLNSLDEVVKTALAGFRIGYSQTGVKVNPIICIPRENDREFLNGNPRYPVNSIDIVKTAINHCEEKTIKVIGIDLVCYEPCAPAQDYLSAFRLTFDTPLKRTIHVGEMIGSDQANLRNIRYVLKHFRPHGLGHALPLHQDQRLVEIVASQQIRIESNPRSNLHCGFIKDVTELGLNTLIEAGVKVTINPDDTFMWPQGHLADNLALVANAYSLETVKQTIVNSIETAWGLSQDEKIKLLQQTALAWVNEKR